MVRCSAHSPACRSTLRSRTSSRSSSPALDAIFPVLPSETAVIALGVAAAGSADPRIVLLIACAAAGAFLGDNLSYLIGRRFGPWAERRFFASGKGARSRAWAERALHRFGMQMIIVCRFIPGGRTGGHADLRAHRLPAPPVRHRNRHRGGDLGAVRVLHRPPRQ